MGLRAAVVFFLAFPAVIMAFNVASIPVALQLRRSATMRLQSAATSPLSLRRPCRLFMQEQKGSVEEEEEEEIELNNSVDSALRRANSDFPDMVPVESTNPAYFVIGGVIGCVPLAILLIETCKVR